MPPLVVEMRDAMLAAAHAGRIEDLRQIFEWNELRPEIADTVPPDPVAYWRSASADGEGREILAALANILSLPPTRLPYGRDIENNGVFVWPYLAERDLRKLTPSETVDLYRLMPSAEAKASIGEGRWRWWRLVIGADGTWHMLKRTAPASMAPAAPAPATPPAPSAKP